MDSELLLMTTSAAAPMRRKKKRKWLLLLSDLLETTFGIFCEIRRNQVKCNVSEM